MDTLWAIIVILLIFFIIFIVIPSLLKPVVKTPISQVQHVHTTVPAHPVGPSIQEIHAMEMAHSKAMLDAHYQSARAKVPENYPLRPVGSCPYAKAPSTDLPMADVPMCMAVQPENMYLHGAQNMV